MAKQATKKKAGKQPAKGRADHLKAHQFKAGISGNKSGRPKGSLSMVALIRKELQANNAKKAKAIVRALLKEAEAGNISHIKELLDRIDGKVADKVEAEFGVVIKGYIELDTDRV